MLPFFSTFLVANPDTCSENGTNCAYTFLEPIPGLGDAGNSIVVSSSTLSTYFNNVYTYVIVIICVIAVFFLMYYGILFLTTDIISKKMEGREGVVKVITGIVFIFSAWVILNSINPNILRNTLFGDGYITNVGTPPTPGPSPGGGNPSGNEEAVRAQLATHGIGVNKPAPATEVGDVDPSLIQTIIQLKQQCSCDIYITGGSEKAGHSPTSNHYQGKAVDLRFNLQLRDWLKTNGTEEDAAMCPGKSRQYKWNGWIFTHETSLCAGNPVVHFHVSPTGR